MRIGTWRSGVATSLRSSAAPTARPRCRRPHACWHSCATAAERDPAVPSLLGFAQTQTLALRLEDEKIEVAVDQVWPNVKSVVRRLENMNNGLVARDAVCLGIARVIITARGAARGGEDDGRPR